MNDLMNLLPIGSVVRLRDARKCLMIFGVCQTDNSDQKQYDYIGVLWPEGNIGNEGQILFNHEDIEETVFVGFNNDERLEFIQRLKQFYETNT